MTTLPMLDAAELARLDQPDQGEDADARDLGHGLDEEPHPFPTQFLREPCKPQ